MGSVEKAFKELKAVYCRALENTDAQFRFSVLRLECMMEIATGVQVKAKVPDNCDRDLARSIEEDPCQSLFEILHDLIAYWKEIPLVRIEIRAREAVDGKVPKGLAADVFMDFSGALADGGMGQDSRHLLETLRQWCSAGTPPKEPDQTRLLIARMEVGPRVEGSSVWRSLRTELIVQEPTQ